MDSNEAQIEKKPETNWTWFLFSLKGRISRKPFWIFNGIIFTGGILLGLFTDVTHDVNNIGKSQLMFMLWIFYPSLAVQAKRWHDINKSAWWLMLNMIPIVGPIWALIENGFITGTRGPNRFGNDPLEESQLQRSRQ
ncbi:MAG: DUF805 domain-containing protein [Desulforhopalus sp.]|nr:DUF805 domain-containing protein [Desulforhopalus sp.]